jgi:hypothetical protein
MRPHELDQAIFDKMDQSPYTIHATVGKQDDNGQNYVNIRAFHPDHEGPIAQLTFDMPSGLMHGMEIHPDHRNGVLAAKMTEKAITVVHRVGFSTRGFQPKGVFSKQSADLLNKIFPKSDGSKYDPSLGKNFSFTNTGGTSHAYGFPLSKWETEKCDVCYGSRRLGLESEDMRDPVKVAQGFKECPHCDKWGISLKEGQE